MKNILLFLCLTIICHCHAQQPRWEQVTAMTDKDCYLAGERLLVRVDAWIDGQPSPSRVAYVEIADTRQLVAQGMALLTDGTGWAEIALPTHMHSGCYQLTAYTRYMRNQGNESFGRMLIGVVNGEQLSRLDDVVFVPLDSCGPSDVERRYKAGDTMRVELPGDCAVTLCRDGIEAKMDKGSDALSMNDGRSIAPLSTERLLEYTPEIEGHIVSARISQGVEAEVESTRLSLVGRNATLYDGQRQADGTYQYYTSGISGNLPVLVHALDEAGRMVPMSLVSPYAIALPHQLPRLTVYADEGALRQRALMARRQALANNELTADTLTHSVSFMSKMPDHFYDLDEYTQMNDIRELLIEFVKGVKRQKRHGVNMLYTLEPGSNSYSKWPALVLLDGMPVYDIDEILHYDAHLVRYVQIYSGIFNFGNSCCCGVISFITRRGRLTNYKLKTGEQLMSYTFPQDHPTYTNYTSTDDGTLLWLPSVSERAITIDAPATPGSYQIIIQRVDGKHRVVREVIPVVVE